MDHESFSEIMDNDGIDKNRVEFVDKLLEISENKIAEYTKHFSECPACARMAVMIAEEGYASIGGRILMQGIQKSGGDAQETLKSLKSFAEGAESCLQKMTRAFLCLLAQRHPDELKYILSKQAAIEHISDIRAAKKGD